MAQCAMACKRLVSDATTGAGQVSAQSRMSAKSPQLPAVPLADTTSLTGARTGTVSTEEASSRVEVPDNGSKQKNFIECTSTFRESRRPFAEGDSRAAYLFQTLTSEKCINGLTIRQQPSVS
jgi:hypothetical protein